jgi:hypothetical protein
MLWGMTDELMMPEMESVLGDVWLEKKRKDADTLRGSAIKNVTKCDYLRDKRISVA